MKTSCSALIFLLLSMKTWVDGIFQPYRDDELEQYTPDRADWTTLNEKAVLNHPKNTDHTPDGIFWISESDWLPWDGTVYNASEYSRSELAQLICPGNTIRGLREVFYEHNPFVDPVNPTKAEVDNWHMIAINHVRAMVGYIEEEYQIKPDKCLHLRALWSDERKNTRKWDNDYPGGCEGTTNPHCGAGFIPSVEDQQPYLPDDIEYCVKTAGSEGLFNSAKSNIPWSIKWARPFCYTLGAEGFWGGHTGPWFHRPRFGWSWRDVDLDNTNSNANLRTKWSGSGAPNKYIDPQVANGDHLVLVEGVDPNPRFPSFQCEQSKWRNGAQNATHCYHLTMDDPDCGKRFMTYVNGGGCACYPVEMDICVPANAANRGTWDFESREDSFDGLMIDVENPLWNGRRCDKIKWKTESKAGDATHCLQKLMEEQYSDCARNFMTWNSANGGCACYPPEQASCERSETVKESGRITFELMIDPSYEPPATTSSPTAVAEPTPVAEPTSTGDCTEREWTKWLFKNKSNGTVKTKNCSWLASKKAKKITNLCENKTESNDQYDTPKKACPITCKTCCDEDEDAQFVLKLKKKNGAKYQTCGWLAKKKNAANICTRTNSYEGIGPPGEVCPITCNTC